MSVARDRLNAVQLPQPPGVGEVEVEAVFVREEGAEVRANPLQPLPVALGRVPTRGFLENEGAPVGRDGCPQRRCGCGHRLRVVGLDERGELLQPPEQLHPLAPRSQGGLERCEQRSQPGRTFGLRGLICRFAGFEKCHGGRGQQQDRALPILLVDGQPFLAGAEIIRTSEANEPALANNTERGLLEKRRAEPPDRSGAEIEREGFGHDRIDPAAGQPLIGLHRPGQKFGDLLIGRACSVDRVGSQRLQRKLAGVPRIAILDQRLDPFDRRRDRRHGRSLGSRPG